jgi:hypothetical protein
LVPQLWRWLKLGHLLVESMPQPFCGGFVMLTLSKRGQQTVAELGDKQWWS